MINDYRCDCAAGYTGRDCETDIDDCQTAPCENNGTCIDQVNGYNCSCLQGFTGHNCSINIDDCTLSPCSNGGNACSCEEMREIVRCKLSLFSDFSRCLSRIWDCSFYLCNEKYIWTWDLLTWPAASLVCWNKRKTLLKNRVNPQKTDLLLQHDHGSLCFAHPTWPPPPWCQVHTIYTQKLRSIGNYSYR